MDRHHHYHQQRLFECLAASPELSPSSIEIKDISRWYAARTLLGPRRHSARIIKRVDATTSSTAIPARLRLRTGDIYSASIFDVDAQTGKIAKTPVGYYASVVQAHRASQKAQDARDERLLDTTKSPTHLKVKIISGSLKGQNHSQRIEVVYQILLKEYSRPSIRGSAVARPHLQNLLTYLPFELLLEIHEDEVNTVPAGVLTELHVPNSVQIARANSKDPILNGMSQQLRQLAMSEYQKSSALATTGRPEMAKTKSKINSRISSGSKTEIAIQKKNKNPLRRHQKNAVETEVSTKLAISALKLCESAMHMQRMWRRRQLHCIQKRWTKLNRAALVIQRVFHGSRGQQKARDWRRSRDLAVVTLQRRFRRRQLTRLATLNQTAARGWLVRRHLYWIMANAEIAITIQKVARGFLGRCAYRQALSRNELLLRHKASSCIQALGRTYIQRSRYLVTLRDNHHQTVELPKIIQLQAFWRMCSATSLLHRLQEERNAATSIQRIARGVSIRRIIQAYRYSLFRHKCATMIQSIARGFLDRCIIVRIKRKNHFHFVVTPSATLIQSIYRGHKERLRQHSAKTIQSAYRRQKFHQLSRDKWLRYMSMLKQRSALMIQTWFRSRSARHNYLHLLDYERSKRLCASRTILHAWRRYKSREKYLLKREEAEYKRSQDTIIALQREQESVRSRINAVGDEIESNRVAGVEAGKRLKLLKNQLGEATSLMGVVESEEAFFSEPDADAERARLQLQLRDVTDSIASCKDIIKSSRSNISRLEIERDMLYVNDLDRLCCFEHEEHENQRKAELQRCMARKEREWRERVRYERTKWAVPIPKAKKEPAKSQSFDMTFHRSVSTTKRGEILEKHAKMLNDEAQKKTDAAIRQRNQNGADNKAVRELYNRIFRNMQSIMKS